MAARKKKTTRRKAPKSSTALTLFESVPKDLEAYELDPEIAQLVKEQDAAAPVVSAGWPFINPYNGGFRLGQDMDVAEIQALVLDHRRANILYEGTYDPKSFATASCFATQQVGQAEADMAPPAEFAHGKHATCVGCPFDEWGSDPVRGRGKACNNYQQLGLLLLDETAKTPAEFLRNSQRARLRLSATALADWARCYTEIRGYQLPLFAVLLKFSTIESGGAFKVVPEIVYDKQDQPQMVSANVANKLAAIVKEARAQTLLYPPSQGVAESKPRKAPRKKAGAKKKVRRSGRNG